MNTLVPLFLICLTLLLPFIFYVAVVRRQAGPVMGGRREESRVLGPVFVGYWFWLIGPIERFFVRFKVSPNWITVAATVISMAAAVLFWQGEFGWGGWLIMLGGTLDILDGRVARARGLSTQSGAFLDSALDRYADIFVLVGLAAYYRHTPYFLIPLIALNGTLVTSYVRARGQSLGVDCKAGLMQRAERIVLVGVSSVLSPFVVVLTEAESPFKLHYLALACVALLAVLSNITAVARILSIYKELGKPQALAQPWLAASDRASPVETRPVDVPEQKARVS